MNALMRRRGMMQSAPTEYQKIGEELVTQVIADRKTIDPNTGELTGGSKYYRRVDYIEVYPQYAYIAEWYQNGTRPFYFAWYTTDKTYISGGTKEDFSSYPAIITPPINAKYIRFSSSDGAGTMSFKRYS